MLLANRLGDGIDDCDDAASRRAKDDAVAVLQGSDISKLYFAGRQRHSLGALDNAGSRAADMEGTKRQLRARLADRLGSDNPYGLPNLHHAARGIVHAITFSAGSVARFASEHRA